MHAGHKEIPWDDSPDRSPVLHYNIKVSQRDLDEIKHLVDRNYAGMTIAWFPTTLAVTRILGQINTQAGIDLDNYDNDGSCPVCKAPEHEDTD